MKLVPAILIALTALVVSIPAYAFQDPAPVRKAVEDYLRVQSKGLPGQVEVSVSNIDPDNQLVPCPAPLEVSLAPGARAWGRTSVAVHCPSEGGWRLFVRVRVRVIAEYLTAARSIAQGQVLTNDDVARQTGDLTDLPAGILTDASQAVGRTAGLSIPGGHLLRSDMLRQVPVVQQNQTVKVVSKGQGFQVASEGRALNNGLAGQVVQVRLANGQIISGIARAGGVVEVAY